MRATGARVYVVDDDASVREAIEGLIRSEGLSAKTFTSSQEFLASAADEIPSCLVLDVELPGLSGLDLQERLLDGGFRTPVIFVTAHPKAKARERALNAGAVAFLSKPFEEISLISAVKSALSAP